VPLWQVEGVVGDDDLRHLVAERTQPFAYLPDLLLVDASVLDGQGAGGVDPEDGHLVVRVERFEVVGDVTAVLVERLEEAREDVVERDVVVARHDDLRRRQRVQKLARLPELL
jgi:hypothetical protein